MQWYLIQTKPRQETRALINLERQGYECYLPIIATEKMVRKKIKIEKEPLFSRYLFVRLELANQGHSILPIRSTLGVSKLVLFGEKPAMAEDSLIEFLKTKEEVSLVQPIKLFSPGEKVLVKEGVFSGFEVIYQMSDPKQRAIVLIDLLSHPTEFRISPSSLSKLK